MRLTRTAARLEQIPTSIVVLSIAAIAGGCTVPHMIAPENADNYYAWASVRLGQEGSVVLHFSIGPDGKAREPISHDEARIVDQGHSLDDRAAARLIEGAVKYIRAAKFDAGGIHKRQVTASFVFEVKPCGTLAHSRPHDYAISLCRERPPSPRVDTPQGESVWVRPNITYAGRSPPRVFRY
jgi:hypothetical protein